MASNPPVTTATNWTLAREKDTAALPERLLLDVVERMEATRAGRSAVHVHLSRLQQHHRRDDYLRIAMERFEAEVKLQNGRLFVLSNNDLFFVVKDMRMDLLVDAVSRLRILFTEDPLTHDEVRDDGLNFVTYYSFVEQYDALYQDLMTLYKNADQQKRERDVAQAKNKGVPKIRPFQPGDLSKLITLLERADLTNIIRRQVACAFGPNGIPLPLFRETYVSISDLQRICTPDIDLLSDRWLFHYLTRTLDKRVLSLMTNGSGIQSDIPFSLNLNIHTLLSPEFRRFDELVPAALRGKTVIEIHNIDVFSDIGAFAFARDFVRERGYLLCLDGLTHYTMPFFDRNKLGLDLFKIYWGSEGLKNAQATYLAEIKKVLEEFGTKRTILCRCDNEDAVTIGRDLGFTQFQGRMIDKLLSLSRK
jgi:hypothetical protein